METSRHRVRRAALALVPTLLTLFCLSSVARGQGECPANLTQVEAEIRVTSCRCSPYGQAGTVWGTDIYTTDSSLCTAAVHAGVIDQKGGGGITLQRAKGCKAYAGTERHGVTSNDWGTYNQSFYFPQAGNGKCTLDILTTGDPDPSAARQYKPGARVACFWKGGKNEYRGKINKIQKGRLIVDYDDGDREAITPSLCRPAPKGDPIRRPPPPKKRPVTGPADPAGARQFMGGSNRVVCRWRDGTIEYPGKVIGVREGRLVLDYDDGGKELISPSLCRRKP